MLITGLFDQVQLMLKYLCNALGACFDFVRLFAHKIGINRFNK